MTPPDLSVINTAFANERDPPREIDESRACAAVALIFRPPAVWAADRELEMCFVQRAPFPGDPWSGDMAFPGGKGEVGDQNFHDIAARETFEETGFRLGLEHYVGSLDAIDVQPVSQKRRLLLKPMVYIAPELGDRFCLSKEIAAAYWIPVRNLWDPSRLTTVDWGSLPGDYPGIEHQGQVIWGLTFSILGKLAARLGLAWH